MHITPWSEDDMRQLLNIYIRYMISKHILHIIFLNEPEHNFFAQLNGFTYFYQIQIILFTINHLFAHS